MKIFVTGGAGFIGSHLLPFLLARGHEVTATGSPRRASTFAGLPEIGWVSAGLEDPAALAKRLHGQDALIHLAGRYPLFGEPHDPLRYVRANVLTTTVALEACQVAGLDRFVFTSTANVYGQCDVSPITETAPLNGLTVYAATKIAAERLVQVYCIRHGIRGVSLRLFNVYGPRQPESNVVATIAAQALGPGAVTIFDAVPERDFVYVGDVAAALAAAVQLDDACGEAINIGSGAGVRIGRLAEIAMELARRDDKVVSKSARFVASRDNPESVVADISLARKLLGWEPGVSLREGLALTLDWMRVNPGA